MGEKEFFDFETILTPTFKMKFSIFRRFSAISAEFLHFHKCWSGAQTIRVLVLHPVRDCAMTALQLAPKW